MTAVPVLTISKAEAMNPSRRSSMEDVHVMYPPGEWGCNDDEMTYIGVYDGHGGRDTVDFLEGSLHQNIAEELNINDANDDSNDKTTPIHTKIERAFLMTDAQSRMAGIETSGATVCVTLIKKHANGRKITIYSANTGDARAVLSCQPTSSSSSSSPSISTSSDDTAALTTTTTTTTIAASTSTPTKVNINSLPQTPSNGNMYNTSLSPRSSRRLRQQQQILIPKAHRLTYDHKSDNDDEIKRIEEAGGFFLRNRVLGIMAVARSLGDHGMKEYVIGRPFISTAEIDLDDAALNNRYKYGGGGNGDGGGDGDGGATSSSSTSTLLSSESFNLEFVIVACDGLWDVIDDQAAVDIVRSHVKSGSEHDDGRERYKKTSATVLCEEALEGGSTDNITIMIAWL